MIKKAQLPLQTLDLIAGFTVWVILSSLLPFIKHDIFIPDDMLALVTAVPVILGSVLRIPFGYYANLLGARTVFLASFIVLLFPVYFLSVATTYVDLLIGGVFLGFGGAIFSVGVTSLPKYYPKERHGFVNGVYGFGNMGTAITTYAAPVLAVQFGWQMAIKFYLGLLLVMIALNFFLGDRHEPKVKTPIVQQIKAVWKDEKLWLFSLFYFVTFGAFVAFTVFLPNFLVSDFGVDGVTAGIFTSLFIVTAAVVRVLGGWLSDHLDCWKLLAGVFVAMIAGALVLATVPGLELFMAGVYVISIACGIGNGVVFKLVPTYFVAQAGPVNGVVSMMGGLGGFFPPLVLSAFLGATGSYAPGFIAFACSILACLVAVVWLGRTESRKQRGAAGM
ncbi:nitrate/nitrite transporter [Raoultibacter phocaeensis]|uniref:nitrate/nitrite transporter n=1 Tax=Raoultibacter phocaeensis TaxID=2479841 RepID=UPI001118B827|nr:MFS transporter [Raoultibacter phocaeensis]